LILKRYVEGIRFAGLNAKMSLSALHALGQEKKS
jgi:hypothetical protein